MSIFPKKPGHEHTQEGPLSRWYRKRGGDKQALEDVKTGIRLAAEYGPAAVNVYQAYKFGTYSNYVPAARKLFKAAKQLKSKPPKKPWSKRRSTWQNYPRNNYRKPYYPYKKRSKKRYKKPWLPYKEWIKQQRYRATTTYRKNNFY